MKINVIPLKYGTKIPVKGCNWRDETVPVDISTINTQSFGIALVLGEKSGIVALDLDDDVDNLHAKVLSIAGVSPVCKVGEKGATYFYRYNGEGKHQYTKNGVCVLDLLGEGAYTVLPPSIHPRTKRPYEYVVSEAGGDWTIKKLEDIELNELPFLPTDFKEQLDKIFGKVKPETNGVNMHKLNLAATVYNTSKEDIEEALTYISPNGYETWINVGMALRSYEEEDLRDIWCDWSSTGDTYKPAEIQPKWESFEADGGITVATIFKLAMDNGYKKQSKDGNVLYKGLSNPTKVITTTCSVSPLYNISRAVDVIKDWKKKGYPVGKYIGVPGFEGESEINWHLRKGELTIVTGYPGDGKSEFVNFMAYSAAKTVGYRTLSFSFEEKSTAHMVESYMTKHAGKIMKPKEEYFNADKHRSDDDDKRAIEFIEKHFLFYDNTEHGNKIEDMVGYAENLKDKVDIIVIDTFSNLRSDYGCSEGDMNHVKHTVQLLSQLCKKLDVHVFFIAHPTKRPTQEQPVVNPNTGNRSRPDLRMVSGGAVFGNQADNGMVIKREGDFNTRITVCKIRDQNYGDCKGEVTLRYDKPSRTFKAIINEF